MQQVSCRALGILLKSAKRRKVPGSLLTEGIPYDLPYLQNTKNRIEWSAFCRVLRNSRAIYSLEDLSDLNEAFMRSPFFAYVGVIARLLFTSRDLFDWICKRQVGGGAQLFSDCVKPSFEHVGLDSTVIRLEITDEYEPSPEFFWMTRGAFIAMPGMVRSGDAIVDMTVENRLATYHVKYRNKRGTVSSLVRWLSMPFTARTAAKELKRTNEELQSRFYELADATSRVERQATQLRTANRVNDLIHGDLDLTRTIESITRALVEEAGFARVELRFTAADASTSFGVGSEPPVIRPLEANAGYQIGELEVIPREDSNRVEREELLEFITPTIVMALMNALSYRELEHYRANLERLVEQRTSELRHARDALANSVEQLRDAQGARERFFGNISHEIRTPLSIVLLAVADIEKRARDKLDARARADLGSIGDSARKLVRLVDDLLLLAAGQEGRLRLQPEPTNLSGLIASLTSAWTPMAEAAGLTLSSSVPKPIIANVDPVAFERIATNLVSNAVKYTPAGGRVDLELMCSGEHLRLAVLDTGPGISDDLSSRLFGRFERGASGSRTGGTGIGLSLVKQLVEGHGGTIVALPRPTGGTELRVELPAALIRDASAPARTPAVDIPSADPVRSVTPPRALDAALAKGTILLAEDDQRLAELIAEQLADEYVVRIAHDGATALELAKRHQPQLLITDVDMPNMDGIELSKRFREVTNDRLAPVIILSAVLDLGTRLAGLDAGAVDYVTKPFEPAELKARVRAQFRMRDLAMRLHRAEQLSTLGVLTSGLAHELRNPANGVVNAIGPLRQLLPAELSRPDQPVGQLLDVIGECADQINMLARQLLGFRNSATDLQLRSTKAHELVHRALSICQEATKDVAVRVQIPEEALIECAPPLMVQVLTNLIENAAHAAGRGGWIEVTAHADPDQLSLRVSDSGPGVPVELRSKVFEPFFTTKMQGTGTGLGLPVSREIVARHGGSIEIEDQGTHSAFVVRIPRQTPSVSAMTTA